MSGRPEDGKAKRPSVVGTVFQTVLPAALAVALFVILVGVTPGQKRRFDDYQMKLPSSTMHVINASMWLADCPPFVVAAAGFALVAAAAGITVGIRYGLRRPGWAAVWVLVQSLPLLLALAYSVYALSLPWQQLREGLRK